MARSPIRDWMPFEIDRFFASSRVQGMKDFQRWWYVSLLLRAWQAEPPCHLPDDDNELRIAAGAPDQKIWDKHSALVLGAFHATGDGHRVNRRQLEIYEEKMEVRAIKKANGMGGGRPKKTETKPNGYHSDSEPSNSSSGVVLVPKKEGFKLPIFIPEKAWLAYLQMRKKKGKDPTDRAKELVCDKLKKLLDAGQNLEKVLYQSVVNCWTDVYAVHEDMVKTKAATVPAGRPEW